MCCCDGGEVVNKNLVFLVPCWFKLAIVTGEKADISGIRPYIARQLSTSKPNFSVVRENLQYFGCIKQVSFNDNLE